jgi:cation diffusion facilitator family transporter
MEAREKRTAALSSVGAAIFLTLMKIVVGVMTHSLGILAEAAHSALDLVAAGVTFFAVKYADRPADRGHTYGHGKIENLSALFETFLLLVTCAWIIYEAIDRLFFNPVAVEATFWSFLVMAISITVDISRSRMLDRVAKKYSSQALEADALHFSTDIWSSAVVLGGLALIWIAERMGIPWLAKADAIAALVVAGIVIYVSLQLGRRAVAEIIDEVPETLQEEITRAASIPGVQEVRQVRVRRSGAKYFIDLTLTTSRTRSSEQVHLLTQQVQESVRRLLPDASILVHTVPVQMDDEELSESLRVLAARYNLGVHHIHTFDLDERKILILHLDVQEELHIEQAHTLADTFENAVLAAYPDIQQVITHLEPTFRQREGTGSVVPADLSGSVEAAILGLSRLSDVPCRIHDIAIMNRQGKLEVTFHLGLPSEMPITQAHELTALMERQLKEQVPDLDHVFIHVEPPEE